MRSASRRWRAEAALAAVTLALPAAPLRAEGLAPDSWEVFGQAILEGTLFFQDPQFPDQERDSVSLSSLPTLQAFWDEVAGGELALRLTPFGRVDTADRNRTHADLREAKADWSRGPWAVTVGADVVFWGKTEAFHLVDIINQDDLVENIDTEEKLGQPLIRVARLADWGEVSAWVMPYFRERTFPGRDGRLRFALPVATGRAVYETDAEEFTPSFALRYAGVIGAVDLGLHVFHGLSRDPAFLPDGDVLLPVYSRIAQGGVDAQYTSGATLWKGEALLRGGQRNLAFEREFYGAFTGGLEHTLFGVMESPYDLGLILEYAVDSRLDDSLEAFQNDLILGARFTFNDEADSAILLTSSIDMTDGALGLRLEAETRLTPNWKVAVEGTGFANTSRNAFAEDSNLKMQLIFSF